MVMQKDTKIHPGSGKIRPYVQRGKRVCIILHLSACTGVDTSVVWNEMVYGSSTAYECCLLLSLACIVSCFLISSRVSPFIVQGGAQGTSIGVRVGVDRGMAR